MPTFILSTKLSIKLSSQKFLSKYQHMIIAKNYSKFIIDKNNKEMCEWALSYLKKRNLVNPRHNILPSPDKFIDIELTLGSISNQAQLELLYRDMRAAWAQKMYRDDRSETEPCTFIIDKQSKKRLKKLAKEIGLPMNRTLEMIINQTYFENKDLKRARKGNPRILG